MSFETSVAFTVSLRPNPDLSYMVIANSAQIKVIVRPVSGSTRGPQAGSGRPEPPDEVRRHRVRTHCCTEYSVRRTTIWRGMKLLPPGKRTSLAVLKWGLHAG